MDRKAVWAYTGGVVISGLASLLSFAMIFTTEHPVLIGVLTLCDVWWVRRCWIWRREELQKAA
jgi:hypothetical protein